MLHPALLCFGYDDAWQACALATGAPESCVARVISERRGQYRITTASGESTALLSGRYRMAMEAEAIERPAVGDWVILRADSVDPSQHIVEQVLPRRTRIARKAPGKVAREQVVVANADTVFVVCAMGRDVNARRIERFATIATAGGAGVVVVLNKADLFDEPEPYVQRASGAAPQAPVYLVSAATGQGMEQLDEFLGPGRTVALLGTSGAGKSTLINRWLGKATLPTGDLRADGRGRHTTTSRQLMPVPSGGVVIDTPGLREVGLGTNDEGLASTFDDVVEIAQGCRFADCRHVGEPGCAVRAAVDEGRLDAKRMETWRRLHDEQEAMSGRSDQLQALRKKASERVFSRAARKYSRDKGRP